MGAAVSVETARGLDVEKLASMAEEQSGDVVARTIRERAIDGARAWELEDVEIVALELEEHDKKHLVEALHSFRPSLKTALAEVEKQLFAASLEKKTELELAYTVGLLKSAQENVRSEYETAWILCSLDVGLQRRDALLAASGELCSDFNKGEVRQSATTVKEVLEMAGLKGGPMHRALRLIVEEANGRYFRGPRKARSRIEEKVREDYAGDVGRILDVERSTGIFQSAEDLILCISLLRGAARQGTVTIRRVKDRLSNPMGGAGYRDLLLNVEFDGFVGELQLTLRRLAEVKYLAHRIYEIDRVLAAGEIMQDQGPGGVESEYVLRLECETVDLEALGEALTKALPAGCTVASLDVTDLVVRVSLAVRSVASVGALRDAVLAGDLDRRLGVRADRGAFIERYARLMMRFPRPTAHQRQKLEQCAEAKTVLLLAPAGGGKTFVAIQRMLQVLLRSGRNRRQVLFVARNRALALFACRWLIAASRAAPRLVVDRLKVLVEPFDRGPRNLGLSDDGKRVLILDDIAVEPPQALGLVVVDESHHLAGDIKLKEQFAKLPQIGESRQTDLLFLGDASQSTTFTSASIISSLITLPEWRRVVLVELTEVVRSTKRIVAGAAAFQLAASRDKGDTTSHTGASTGPPLKAVIFQRTSDLFEDYARHVLQTLANVALELGNNLHDRVAVVVPDETFLVGFRTELEKQSSSYKIVDAATASSIVPLEDEEIDEQWLVVDTIDSMDGLERLIVLCVGMDAPMEEQAATVRSRLYRAMTRAQMKVVVINENLPRGWLQFLLHVELSDAQFGTEQYAKDPADRVLQGAAVEEKTEEAPKEEEEEVRGGAMLPRRLGQTIWETGECVGAASEDPSFMPFITPAVDDQSSSSDEEQTKGKFSKGKKKGAPAAKSSKKKGAPPPPAASEGKKSSSKATPENEGLPWAVLSRGSAADSEQEQRQRQLEEEEHMKAQFTGHY